MARETFAGRSPRPTFDSSPKSAFGVNGRQVDGQYRKASQEGTSRLGDQGKNAQTAINGSEPFIIGADFLSGIRSFRLVSKPWLTWHRVECLKDEALCCKAEAQKERSSMAC